LQWPNQRECHRLIPDFSWLISWSHTNDNTSTKIARQVGKIIHRLPPLPQTLQSQHHRPAMLLVIKLISCYSRIWSSKWHSLVKKQACCSRIWPSTNGNMFILYAVTFLTKRVFSCVVSFFR
jgi:hypothetical protein